MAFIAPATVMPLFIATLTDWNWLIGIAASIHMGGWFLPQVFSANLVSGRKYRLPLYRNMSIIRICCLGSIAGLTLLLGGSNRVLLLILFLILYPMHAVTGGIAGLAFLDIVGKTIPSIAKKGIPGLGSFFGYRIFLGALLGILCGLLLINPILDKIKYPHNFALLFGISTFIIILGVISFCLIKEPPSETSEQIIRMNDHLLKSLSLLRSDLTFRKYFITRHFLMLWTAGIPFYILFAASRYELSAFWVGAFIAARYAGEMTMDILWAILSDRGHNRKVIQGASLLTLIPPLVVFIQIYWNIPEIAYALAFFASGGVIAGMMLGGNNYLLEHAPPDKRPMYIGLMNSTLGFTILSAGLGGLIVDQFGFPPLFLCVGLISLVAMALSYRLEPAGKLN